MKIERFEDLECWKEARILVNMGNVKNEKRYKKRKLTQQTQETQ